ncbi:hypothetical protein [Craterilacuibacter sp. RT1T]|uniref:hypothetical protein n=1 Tax=Craterilacuibacter sp. RT1T TaxID=2942211 RepID=UPI0020BD7899|nr:hypothetical protein [Craterilacuibacter sp. RT1T]MCL6263275.1 hypothetical protein [Craterilacuibacter sp. RT1T]
MNSVKQTAIGNNNNQVTNIYIRPLDTVDICADKISLILGKIAHIDFFSPPPSQLIPPKIADKNTKNAIDAANSIEIEQTYALWNEITDSIRLDATGVTESYYRISAFLLNQLYVANFQLNFPGFKIHALGVYCQHAEDSIDDAHVFIHLIHYMYLSCQIGLTP